MTLGGQVTAGLRSTGASTAITSAINFVQTVVLARLLAPADFGVVAMATVVIGFARLLVQAPFGPAIIQRREITRESLSSLFWLNAIVALATFAAIVAGAPVVASAYREPRIAALLGWAAVPLLVAALGEQFQTLLERELEFDRLARIDIAAAALGAGVAIAAALAGSGMYALVAGPIVSAVARTAALAAGGLARWCPMLRLKRSDLEGFLGFGAYHGGQRLCNFVTANVDFYLIGTFLGAEALGRYAVAYNLADTPSTRVNAVVSRVVFPVLARVGEDQPRVRAAYLRFQELSAAVNFPIVFGMAGTASVFVPLFYGEAWRESARLLEILAVVGLGRAIAGTIGPLILARGRPDLGFRWSMLIVLIHVPGIYLGVRTGSAAGVASAFAILVGLYVLLNYAILVRPLAGPCLAAYVRSMWTPLWICALMAAVVCAIGRFASPMLPPAPLLAVQVSTGTAIYAALTWFSRRALVREALSLALGKSSAR